MKDRDQPIRLSEFSLRLALAVAFLSAVADRFGLWGPPGSGNVAWGNFGEFLKYTGILLPILPSAFIPAIGWLATVTEVVLAVGLLAGWRIRWFAWGSAILLFTFATCMTLSLGPEPALSYSVWTAAAASMLLATRGRGSAEIM